MLAHGCARKNSTGIAQPLAKVYRAAAVWGAACRGQGQRKSALPTSWEIGRGNSSIVRRALFLWIAAVGQRTSDRLKVPLQAFEPPLALVELLLLGQHHVVNIVHRPLNVRHQLFHGGQASNQRTGIGGVG